MYDRLIGLAERALKESSSSEPRNQLTKLRIEVASADAAYQNAKLTREVAEIAVTEYTEGIFVQDLAKVEGEIKFARGALSRARDMVEFAKDRLARITARSDKSVTDLNLEYVYSDRVVAAERDETRKLAVLELAEAKKKVLVEYTKTKTVKQLQSEVEKARGDGTRQASGLGLPESPGESIGEVDQAAGPGHRQ